MVRPYLDENQSALQLPPFERLAFLLFAGGIIFAALGLGEAVYRVLFFEFDGATDRLPLEMLAGFVIVWIATKLVRKIQQRRLAARARIKLIQERNQKIRNALEAIVPVSVPGHQQAIRVIREEVDRIDHALTDILPPHSEKPTLRERLAIFH